MNSYLIIKVEGKIIEKFILRCKKNNINLLKIERFFPLIFLFSLL